MELTEILKNTELFSGASGETVAELAGIGTLREVPTGQALFREGEKGTSFFIVVTGRVAINKNVAGGRKRNLSNLGTGEIFGELALFDTEPRSADAETVETTTLVEMPNEAFLGLLKKNLEFADLMKTRIISILCRRLRRTDDMLKEGVIWGFSMDF